MTPDYDSLLRANHCLDSVILILQMNMDKAPSKYYAVFKKTCDDVFEHLNKAIGANPGSFYEVHLKGYVNSAIEFLCRATYQDYYRFVKEALHLLQDCQRTIERVVANRLLDEPDIPFAQSTDDVYDKVIELTLGMN